MPEENLITQILREKREGVERGKAKIESVGVTSTDVWMLGDKTYEEAKKHILSNPNFADVTFRGDNVLRGDNIIGYLRHDGIVYYFNPVGDDLPYLGETLSPQRNRSIHITAEDSALRYRDTAMLGEAVIRDHITKSNSYYTADFEWLLQEKLNAPFDLFAFTEYPTKVVYSGELKGVPITITLEFPAAIGHCHYHVFWSA